MATFASVEAAKIASGELEPDESAKPKYEPKKLNTTQVGSIFDLKNELLKKKATVTKNQVSGEYKVGKAGLLAVKRDEREQLKQEKYARKNRIAELARKIRQDEQDALDKSAQRLKEKSETYDRLSKGVVMHHKDNTPVEFMVDFSARSRDDDHRGGYGYNYDEPSSSRKIGPVYYNPDEEPRVLGVSHMKLSADQETREKEIQRIKNMSKQTEKDREKHKVSMDQKEEQRFERTNRLRREAGLPELKRPTPPPEPSIDDIPLPTAEETQKSVREENAKRLKSDREWDRGKGDDYDGGKERYKKWIEKQREERDDDFRPPDSYYR